MGQALSSLGGHAQFTMVLETLIVNMNFEDKHIFLS